MFTGDIDNNDKYFIIIIKWSDWNVDPRRNDGRTQLFKELIENEQLDYLLNYCIVSSVAFCTIMHGTMSTHSQASIEYLYQTEATSEIE